MASEHEFDRLVDEGVRRYMDAEPSLGLENRVLAALEEKRRPDWWRRWWMIGVPAMATLALVIGIAMRRKPATPAPVVTKASTPAPATTAPTATQAASVQRDHTARPNLRPRITPRQVLVKETRPQQFPSPVAPTEQEQILAQLARRGRAPVAVAEVQPPPAKDVNVPLIEISELQIKPLPDPNNGQ